MIDEKEGEEEEEGEKDDLNSEKEDGKGEITNKTGK